MAISIHLNTPPFASHPQNMGVKNPQCYCNVYGTKRVPSSTLFSLAQTTLNSTRLLEK